MAKAKQKTQKIGFEVQINRTGDKGAKNWEGVGWIFTTKHEAQSWLNKHHSTIKVARILGVKANVEPVQPPTRNDSQERVRS